MLQVYKKSRLRWQQWCSVTIFDFFYNNFQFYIIIMSTAHKTRYTYIMLPPFQLIYMGAPFFFSAATNCFQEHKGEQCRWLHRYLNGSLTWKLLRWWFYISSRGDAYTSIHAAKCFNIMRYAFIGNLLNGRTFLQCFLAFLF